MAKQKRKEVENADGSVKQSPGITAGRTAQERRVGSGNVRRGSARNIKAAERSR